VNSYIDFYNAIEKSGADTSMIARGAIIKPWIFEEITQRQHLDKSASERLEMLKQYAHWGLEHWVLPLFPAPFPALSMLTLGGRDLMHMGYPTHVVSSANSCPSSIAMSPWGFWNIPLFRRIYMIDLPSGVDGLIWRRCWGVRIQEIGSR